MIYTRGLTYKYKSSNSLIFPDIKVEKGESLLVSGESGCGKTTLLHLLAGLKPNQNGDIFFNNQNITELSASKIDKFRGKHIGFVFQQSYFIKSLSVIDNIKISPFYKESNNLKSIYNRLQIDQLLNKLPHQLSQGQQQRVSIARAVINAPKVILADEPTSALDNINCSNVISLLKEEAKLNHSSLIIVSHDNRLKNEFKNQVELPPLKTK